MPTQTTPTLDVSDFDEKLTAALTATQEPKELYGKITFRAKTPAIIKHLYNLFCRLTLSAKYQALDFAERKHSLSLKEKENVKEVLFDIKLSLIAVRALLEKHFQKEFGVVEKERFMIYFISIEGYPEENILETIQKIERSIALGENLQHPPVPPENQGPLERTLLSK